jgi:hypothetical protein
MVCKARFPDGLQICRVAAIGYGIAAEIQGTITGEDFSQRHEVLSIHTYVWHIMMDSTLAALYRPTERISRDRSGNRKAIVNSSLDFRTLFIVIPGD